MAQRTDRIVQVIFWLLIVLAIVALAVAAWKDAVDPLVVPRDTKIHGY